MDIGHRYQQWTGITRIINCPFAFELWTLDFELNSPDVFQSILIVESTMHTRWHLSVVTSPVAVCSSHCSITAVPHLLHCHPPPLLATPPVQELQELQELQEVQGATLTSGPGADTGRGPLLALGGVQQQPCAVSMCTLRTRGGPQANTKCLYRYYRKSFQKCIQDNCIKHQSVLCSLTLSWKYRGVCYCLQLTYLQSTLHVGLAWLLAR